MATYVMRLRLSDRPGALGAVASRVGAVGGDVVGIEILERGDGQAFDELVVELDDDSLCELVIAEVTQVDGVAVEELVPLGRAWHDPRLDALQTAAVLVGADTTHEVLEVLCTHARQTLGGEWCAVLDAQVPEIIVASGPHPDARWLAAFIRGSQMSARSMTAESGPADVVWAPLPAAGQFLLVGRDGPAFRTRERHQAAALARIADTRYSELARMRSRRAHPSGASF